MEMTWDDTKEMVNGGLSVQRLFFTASNTNIRRPILYSIHFSSRLRKPGPTPHCCPHHLNLASPSWLRSLCLTKRSGGKTKKKSNKKRPRLFSLLEPSPSLYQPPQPDRNQKPAENPREIRSKGEKASCILLHGHTASEKHRKTSLPVRN